MIFDDDTLESLGFGSVHKVYLEETGGPKGCGVQNDAVKLKRQQTRKLNRERRMARNRGLRVDSE